MGKKVVGGKLETLLWQAFFNGGTTTESPPSPKLNSVYSERDRVEGKGKGHPITGLEGPEGE